MATFDIGYAEYEDDEVKAAPIQLMGDHSAKDGQTNANILCCQCGATIPPNPTNMCVQCLSTRCDITEGIATQLSVHRCRGCERWLRPGWMKAELESPELMALCLKKIRGISKVNLVDASWIWTEPHSMRLKVKLIVQKEVMGGCILQQTFVVEFVIRNQQCDECARQYTDGTWKSVVQVRQRVNHKRTFYYLEQLLLKNNAHSRALSIQSFRDGMDFYFTERNEAMRFASFLQNVVPVKVKDSKKLISADNHSNLFNFKYTHLMVIAPICKDDLVILPKALARHLGDISPLVIVERITSLIHVVDPITCDRATFDIDAYTKSDDFGSVLSNPQLQEFVVLGLDAIMPAKRAGATSQTFNSKTRLAAVELARVSDLGKNDVKFETITHLGHLLRAGDTVHAYDLTTISALIDDKDLRTASSRRDIPDVLIVRKLYGVESTKRGWTLKKLEVDVTGEGLTGTGPRRDALQDEGEDYERFMQQLESDKEMRKQVALYKDESLVKKHGEDEEDEDEDLEGEEGGGDDEKVKLDELLSGFHVNEDLYNFKQDQDDVNFLAGKFVPPEDVSEAAEKLSSPASNSAASPDSQDPDKPFQFKAKPQSFNFL